MSYGIRHKGRCCPEYACLYDPEVKECKECGADCKKCRERGKSK
jgi:hypothetical protein